MKTQKYPTALTSDYLSRVILLFLAAALMTPAATALAQSFYTNNSTGDFNVAAYWNPNGVPSGDVNAANDNGSNDVVLIQPGDPVWSHGDTLAGQTPGDSGAYLQTGSTNDTGYPSYGNWLRLGIGTGGTAGYYILSNGVVNVAGRTQIGENGTGYLEVDGGTYNTGYNGNPGLCCANGDFGPSAVGTLVLNGGTINNINNETWFGEANSTDTGYFNMSGGTYNANNWFVFGRNGGNGFGTMTGGTINFHGGGQFLIGGGGVGSLAQSGGTINVYNQYLVPQSNGSGSGTGTNILSGTAVLNVHDWLAVGRNSGYGELDISSNAAITRDNNNSGQDSNSHFDVGAGGPGVVNQNGGVITESTSDFWLGESANGTWNLNSGSAFLQNLVMSVDNSANSTLNLNGGLMQVIGINSTSEGISSLNISGGTLQAAANNATFISGLSDASLSSGGAAIDSQGYSIMIPQELDGSGGLTKLGSGILTLSGPNTYGGATVVSNGTLAVETPSSANGDYTVEDGATFGLTVGSANDQLNMNALTVGSSTGAALDFDLGNFGNPSSAPMNVGALTITGSVTINVADALPQIGQFPLIQYVTKSGSSYALGPLPAGVVANLVDDTANNSIDLKITSVNVPRWDGNAGGTWDIGQTTNWVNLATGLPTYYDQGNLVTFNDSATGTTNVNLVANVTPGSVTINNSVLVYTLTGTGSINGATGLLKEGSGSFAIQTVNGYTGPTTITGGTLSVNNLANGGSPSAIGASSADPTNLVLSDGTFSYDGPAVSVNRGYSLESTNDTIDTESNLTLSGAVAVASTADFIKSGPAQLTYAGIGAYTLSGSTSLGYRTIGGTTVFDGSNGPQTNTVQGHFGVGGLGGTNAAVVLTNTTLNVPNGGVDLGRSGGATGTLMVESGAVFNATGGNMALGDGDGVSSTGVVNQTAGTVNTTGQIFVGQNNNGVGVYNLSGGTFNVANWLAIGRQGGTGTFNLSGTGALYDAGGGGGNIDIGTSAGISGFAGSGTLNQTGGTITNTASQTWLGEGASGEPTTGTWNMTGGTALLGELLVGVGGMGTNAVNISGAATITCDGFMGLSMNDTNVNGIVNIGSASQPGGSITVFNDMTVGDQGTAVLNMVTNGGGQLTVSGTLYLSRSSQQANGTVNLNAGSTIIAGYVNNGWGFHNNFPTPTNNPNAFNFNGGTLKAYVGSLYFIQPYVNAVVQAGGAVIDDGGYSIEVLAALVNGGGGGGLTKLGNGTLWLNATNTYTGATLVSAGTLEVGALDSIAGPVSVASGATLAGDTGSIETFYINNTLRLSAGSVTAMKLTSSSNDQIAGLTQVTYGGSLVVTNVSGVALTPGSQFKLFNASSAGSGNFASVTILPSGSGTFNPSTGILTITSSGVASFNPVTVSDGNLILTGNGGAAPGSGYTVLTTTNLATPLIDWTTNTTGTLDGSGMFSNSIPINPSNSAEFFDLRVP